MACHALLQIIGIATLDTANALQAQLECSDIAFLAALRSFMRISVHPLPDQCLPEALAKQHFGLFIAIIPPLGHSVTAA